MIKNQDSPIKTTLWDLLETAPASLSPGVGLSSIVKIEERMEIEDLVLIPFFYIDELWLIENGVYDLAVAGMIIKLEDRLRKQLLMMPVDKRPSDKELEEMPLDALRKQLETQLSSNSNQKIKEINRIRRAFVHTNMQIGEEIVRAIPSGSASLLSADKLGLVAIQKHENMRMHLKYHAVDLSIDMLMACLSVLRELHADTIKDMIPHFDHEMQRQIRHRKDVDSITKYYKEQIKLGKAPKNFLEKIWDELWEKNSPPK